MGTAHSKRTTENLDQEAPIAEHVSAKPTFEKKALAANQHETRDDNVSPFRHSKATTMHRLDTQKEEKMPDSFSELDLRQMMQSMGNMDRRHHASRAAVYPIPTNTLVDEQHYEQAHPSRTMRIEPLPPPIYETKKRLRGSSSLPVRCPSKSRPTSTDGTLVAFSEDGDSEYLSKLYDIRTWNMYRLITEARRKQKFEYQPSVVEEKTCEMEDEDHVVEEHQDSFTTNMTFAFDFE